MSYEHALLQIMVKIILIKPMKAIIIYYLLMMDKAKHIEQFQINIDIQSLQSANVKCISIDPFPSTAIQFSDIPIGFTPLPSNDSDTLALDFVRRPIFDLKRLTESQSITADQIAAKLDVYLKQDKPNVIVFGTKYDDQHSLQANHYGLQRAAKGNKPSRGIDDVHMNQTIGKNGQAYQDGALFIEKENAYVGFFFSALIVK